MPVPVVRSLQEVRITTEGDGKLVMDCAQWFKGGDYIYGRSAVAGMLDRI
jgi:hypothetical protein